MTLLRRACRVALLSLLIGSPVLAADPPDEAKGVQGAWTFEWVETNGERREPNDQETAKQLVIGPQHMTHGEARFRYSIDSSTDPKVIDIIIERADEPALTFEGIYQLAGDRLTICLNLDVAQKVRPVDFKTGANSKLIVVQFRRAK
jgi:uncharacterized protein (TIGR03067 family)